MITIKKDTLLGLIYNYWYLKAGKAPTESGHAAENLCHFCRVILGWTFVRWFFCARTMKIVMPWLVALIIAFVTVFYLWPEITKLALWYTLIGIGCLAAIIGFLVGIIFGITYGCDKLDPNGDWPKKFLRRKVVGRLPVWFFLSAILLATGLRFFVEITLTFVSILSLYGVAIYLALKAHKKIKESGLIDKKLIPDSLCEIFGTIWAYLKAKKQKICPQILVELDERNKMR